VESWWFDHESLIDAHGLSVLKGQPDTQILITQHQLNANENDHLTYHKKTTSFIIVGVLLSVETI